jgi:predicted nucleotidyltransferase component of viral defense system
MREQYLREATAAGPHATNRMRELLQWEILSGLHREESFRHIAFVGGTCLRLLHGLHRFSEDLDFSMIGGGDALEITSLSRSLQRHLAGSGFDDVEITSSHSSGAVTSIWLKFPRLLHELGASPMATQKLSIKLEIDRNPPDGASVETKVKSTPSLMAITAYDIPSLMAGKLHAILARPYTKGRDWYDLLWYLGKAVEPNTTMLTAALAQRPSRYCKSGEEWRKGATSAAEQCDWNAVLRDVSPFLENASDFSLLNKNTLLCALGNR